MMVLHPAFRYVRSSIRMSDVRSSWRCQRRMICRYRESRSTSVICSVTVVGSAPAIMRIARSAAICPVGVEYDAGSGALKVRNKRWFTSLDDVVLVATTMVDGKSVASNRLIPGAVAPGQGIDLALEAHAAELRSTALDVKAAE